MSDEEIELSASDVATGSDEKQSDDEATPGHRRQRSRFSSLDLETGKPLDERGSGKVKVMSTREACGSLERRTSNIKKDFQKAVSPLRKRKATKQGSHVDNLDPSVLASPGSVHGRLMVEASHVYDQGDSDSSRSVETVGIQYRLSAHKPRTGKFFRLLKAVGITVGSSGVMEDSGGGENSGCLCCGFNLNRFVTTYLNWTFRSSFLKVLLSAAFGFYSLTLFFALLIFASGNNHPDCVHVNGYDFGQPQSGDRFADAYALSWTTFSTVGYGLVFPSTTGTAADHRKCTGIQILCTFESFVGILFASFCGAIVFGKVARTRSHAQVTFSDPIVVRYGKGVKEEFDSDSSSDEEEQVGGFANLQCPVLEFRVINRLHSTKSGEIMDATMNVVASINECQACHSVRVGPTRNRRRRGKRRDRRPSVGGKAGVPRTVSEQESLHSLQSAATGDSNDGDTMDPTLHPRAKAYQVDDEEQLVDGETVSRRIFSKIELETPDHPFFKRVWTASHTLNEHSPLLTAKARRLVRENNGFWPTHMNNHESVRESVSFHQILVSLSGTSNADANTVYAQKVYDYVDMNVGYRFVNVLYRNPRDGSIGVDPSLVNDVLEQSGGGAEPLTYDEGDRHSRRILVL